MGRGTGEEMMDDVVPCKKADEGKAPAYQGALAYFPLALLAVADVSAYGLAKYKLKYEDKNWTKMPDGFGRYSDALLRHLARGTYEERDEESQLFHHAMAAWNALARLELFMVQRGGKN